MATVLSVMSFSVVGISRADDTMRTVSAPTVSASPSLMSPVLVPMTKGQVAPFTGVLLNPPAVAQITVDKENQKKECDLSIKRESETQKALADRALKDKDSELTYTRDTLTQQIKSRDEAIARLQKDTLSSSGNGLIWGIVGFAGGVLMTVGIVYAVSKH